MFERFTQVESLSRAYFKYAGAFETQRAAGLENGGQWLVSQRCLGKLKPAEATSGTDGHTEAVHLSDSWFS